MAKTKICPVCEEKFTYKRKSKTYCSNSCRSRFWQIKEGYNTNQGKVKANKDDTSKEEQLMTLQGVLNAAAGAGSVELIKQIILALKGEDNQTVKKKDLEELKQLLLKRYYPIKNLPNNGLNQKPYFDIESGEVVYKTPFGSYRSRLT